MGPTILIIDDEESIRFSFKIFLTAEGYHVITAETYGEALSRMDETTFDLILADIILEDGWGLDILKVVMKRMLKTRVIIMTAYPSTQTAEYCSRMHAAEYLIKPLRQKGLLHCVNKLFPNMIHKYRVYGP